MRLQRGLGQLGGGQRGAGVSGYGYSQRSTRNTNYCAKQVTDHGASLDICLPYNSYGGMLALASSAHKIGRIHTQAGIPATLLKEVRSRHHRSGISRRLIAKFSADVGGKVLVNIEEGVGLEFLWEHADVLEVYDANFLVRVEEEILLLDVGVVDTTTPLERG